MTLVWLYWYIYVAFNLFLPFELVISTIFIPLILKLRYASLSLLHLWIPDVDNQPLDLYTEQSKIPHLWTTQLRAEGRKLLPHRQQAAPNRIHRCTVDICLKHSNCPCCVPVNNEGRKWTSHYSYKMKESIHFAQDEERNSDRNNARHESTTFRKYRTYGSEVLKPNSTHSTALAITIRVIFKFRSETWDPCCQALHQQLLGLCCHNTTSILVSNIRGTPKIITPLHGIKN